MIECKVRKQYGARQALDLDCAFEEGKIYAIIGNNGSGKSTLLNALAKQIPYEGEIKAPKSVVYMTQQAYNFDFSVRRNVLLFVGKKETERIARAQGMMQAIGLVPLSAKNAQHLSGGERQKTALLRTLMQDGDLLLLDEPTSSMDLASAKIAQDLIAAYHERTGCTIFLVTHSIAQAEALADEILYMDEGRIVERGKDVTSAPSTESLLAFLRSR